MAELEFAPLDPEHEALAASLPVEWVMAARSRYSMHGSGLVRNILAGAVPLIQAAERERIRAALAARKITLTRPGWGFKAPQNTDMVPWEAVAEILGGDETAADPDGEALARVRQLAKTWAGLPADTAASLTLRHAGAQLLGAIEGGEASGVTHG